MPEEKATPLLESTARTAPCDVCGAIFPVEHLQAVAHHDGLVCPDCLARDYGQCGRCRSYVRWTQMLCAGDGLNVCDACLNNLYAACVSCGEFFPNSTLTPGPNGDLICETCLAAHYAVCDDCGEYVRTDTLTAVGDEDSDKRVCSFCLQDRYTQCQECGEWTDDPVTDSHRRLCPACYEELFFTCGECGRIVRLEEEDDSGDGLCVSCRGGEAPASRFIRSYHCSPGLHFHGRKGAYYGIEIETDGYAGNLGKVAKDLLDPKELNYWMSYDGSLASGIEFVFQPRTLESWLEYRPEMNRLRQRILAGGGRSYDTSTCGVHIHRSRRDLTDLATARLITAFIRFRPYIERIAQRKNDQWASFKFLERQTGENCKLVYKNMKAGQYTGDRYVALNLSNRNTIEFRIFKGTLATDTLYGYLLFTHFITQWCKQASILDLINHEPPRLWAGFKQYLGTEGKQGKLLLAYIERKVR